MDISGVSANGAVLAQQEVYAQNQVNVSMFEKALDTQSQNAMALIDSLPQLPSTQDCRLI
ncbi:MAG: putative motility protein [Pseudomonadota bacterium]|nr:putative motility protein [Pseudomonadota bacterium]